MVRQRTRCVDRDCVAVLRHELQDGGLRQCWNRLRDFFFHHIQIAIPHINAHCAFFGVFEVAGTGQQVSQHVVFVKLNQVLADWFVSPLLPEFAGFSKNRGKFFVAPGRVEYGGPIELPQPTLRQVQGACVLPSRAETQMQARLHSGERDLELQCAQSVGNFFNGLVAVPSDTKFDQKRAPET